MCQHRNFKYCLKSCTADLPGRKTGQKRYRTFFFSFSSWKIIQQFQKECKFYQTPFCLFTEPEKEPLLIATTITVIKYSQNAMATFKVSPPYLKNHT